jgi:hypothetical protein
LDRDRDALRPGAEQELAAIGRLQHGALLIAELEVGLQAGRLARTLGAEEVDGGVAGDHRASFRPQEVTGVLSCEHQRAVVLPDPARERDDEAADGGVFEEEAELVDREHSASVPLLDARPQRLCQQEVHRRDHLRPQLAHAEDDERRLEVDGGGPAEDPPQRAATPATEDAGGAGGGVEPVDDVGEQGLALFEEGAAGGVLDVGPFGLVQRPADDRAEIGGVRHRRAQGPLLTPRAMQPEHVDGHVGAQRQANVSASERFRQPPVLVFRIDDEDLRTKADGAHGQGGHQVRLARP